MAHVKYSPLSSEDLETIRDFYDNFGYTQAELAEIFGVSRTTIRRVLDGEHVIVTDNDRPPQREPLTYTFGHPKYRWPKVIDNVRIGLLTALPFAAWAFVVWILWRAA